MLESVNHSMHHSQERCVPGLLAFVQTEIICRGIVCIDLAGTETAAQGMRRGDSWYGPWQVTVTTGMGIMCTDVTGMGMTCMYIESWYGGGLQTV